MMVNLGSFSSSSVGGKKSETTTNIFALKQEEAKKIKLIVAPKKNLRECIHIYFSTRKVFVMF